MAKEDWAPKELTRERRLADVLVRRRQLEPPVDVHAVAAEFADVEHDDIPGQCDGLVVGLDARVRSRPLIILTRATNLVRERFTVAHELGHVLLPWHGTTAIACDVDVELASQAYQAKRAEAEANRFAADLLVPSRWLFSLIQSEGTDDVGGLLGAIRPAHVSAHVACLALSRQLPPGYVFVVLEGDGTVALSGTSPATSIDAPKRGSPATQRLDRFADKKEVLQFGTRPVVWWRFTRVGIKYDDDIPPSKELLADLLDRHVADSKQAHAIRASIAGIVGSANNSAGSGRRFTEEELYERLRVAFTKARDFPPALLDDPLFATWIQKRAHEVAGRT